MVLGFRVTFPLLGGIFQMLIIVLFALLVDYGDHAVSPHRRIGEAKNQTQENHKVNDVAIYYPMFMDIHVLVFMAFGFLLSFLKRFSYGGVAFTFFGGALAAQWGILMTGIFNELIWGHPHIELSIKSLTSADVSAVVMLIAYCGSIGYCSHVQLIVISFFAPIFFAVNEMVVFKLLQASDSGGSMFVHAFGCYYGLAFCRMLYRKETTESSKVEASYTSDVFALLGSILLWCYWPSFNSVFGAPDYVTQHRTVINTYLGLAASAVVVYLTSAALDRNARITLAHIQNATLAGGVAVGTGSSMMMTPWGALLVGSIGGAISTFGFKYVSPIMTRVFKTNDVAGIHNLHGMPGLLGGIAGAIIASQAEPEMYGYEGLYNVFGARAPAFNTTEYYELKARGVNFSPGEGRTAKRQALFQLAALGCSMGISVFGGVLTGLVARMKIFMPPKKHQLYDDADYFEIPEGKDAYYTLEHVETTLDSLQVRVEQPKKEEQEQLMKDK
ncbi:ammonium transporter Rh type A [Exaiptasia diaphana]|uniref:Ammonium transporter AmtB-like domain-containing protein n=1 Tax=Exaiptasia diaphana TaxID=2652724 RepID=A0A913WSK5_EXADI|nr:ammonium transporter Rh type A [Exaiptasia diaphana]KXJ18333.1 Ammonium transporter Rh type C [Exaiptasia diaphana]